MMKKINLLVLIMSALAVFSGCKKDSTEVDKASLITGKSWKLTAYTEGGKDELHSTYDDCELDDIATYFAGGKLVMNQGTIKCNNNDPQTEDLKWSIDGDKLTISQEGYALKIEATIAELSAKTLKYSLKNPFGSETFVYTYTAQ